MPTAAIVGAGVFGSSLARQLAIDGWDVTLVEQQSPGWDGSSSGGEDAGAKGALSGSASLRVSGPRSAYGENLLRRAQGSVIGNTCSYVVWLGRPARLDLPSAGGV